MLSDLVVKYMKHLVKKIRTLGDVWEMWTTKHANLTGSPIQKQLRSEWSNFRSFQTCKWMWTKAPGFWVLGVSCQGAFSDEVMCTTFSWRPSVPRMVPRCITTSRSSCQGFPPPSTTPSQHLPAYPFKTCCPHAYPQMFGIKRGRPQHLQVSSTLD